MTDHEDATSDRGVEPKHPLLGNMSEDTISHLARLSRLMGASSEPTSARKLVIILAEADPIEFPVVDVGAEEKFFDALRDAQSDNTMTLEMESALLALTGERVFLRPSGIISAFCFSDANEN